MNGEFIEALDQIEKEKGIDKDVLLEAIEAALISAYKRNFSTAQNVKVKVNRETGEVKVYASKVVTENPKNECLEIDIDEAKSINRDLTVGDIIDIEVTPKKFGRIAAQTAKQVVVQRIREAERGIIYKEFIEKENEIVTSMIQRIEKKTVFVDLGKAEGILTAAEQVPTEEYKVNDRLKIYILDVKKTTKGPQILVSRSHPGLVKRLFEMEVPEIQEGIVQIKGIAREAGSRTKIAVHSIDESIDPVGSCVGHKGTRVQKIVDELRGEKIDIIKWSQDPAEYIASALSPAKVLSTEADEEEKTARVVVDEQQLSLAIGKEGQNARLAAKLTGWKIDIKSQSF
ncbi:MAG TPA: transcription termination/antitermination protein NusA [Clostridiales bacterium]|nr:transcription termination/antitermination protein NusA [Clostridiales bacterium]